MAQVVGLCAFLERANLASYSADADAFCRSCGAIHVREVLEDAEICSALQDHLKLKRLEVRRFEVVAEQVRSDLQLLLGEAASSQARTEEAAQTEGTQSRVVFHEHEREVHATPRASLSQPFARVGWGSRAIQSSRRGRGGLGRNTLQNTCRQAEDVDSAHAKPEFNPFFACAEIATTHRNYFDVPDLTPEDDGNVNDHYFSKPRCEASSVHANERHRSGRESGIQHYFDQDSGSDLSLSRSDLRRAAQSDVSFGRGLGRGHRSNQVQASPPDHHYFTAIEPVDECKALLTTSESRVRSGRASAYGRIGRGTASSVGRGEQGVSIKETSPFVAGAEVAKPSVLDTLADKRRQEEEALAAKRQAARQRRRQQAAVGETSPEGNDGERRVDPENGIAYTLEEIRTRYRQVYTAVEIQQYWRDECRPASAATDVSHGVGHAIEEEHGDSTRCCVGTKSGYCSKDRERLCGERWQSGGGSQEDCSKDLRSCPGVQRKHNVHGGHGRGAGNNNHEDSNWSVGGKDSNWSVGGHVRTVCARRIDPDDGREYCHAEFNCKYERSLHV